MIDLTAPQLEALRRLALGRLTSFHFGSTTVSTLRRLALARNEVEAVRLPSAAPNRKPRTITYLTITAKGLELLAEMNAAK